MITHVLEWNHPRPATYRGIVFAIASSILCVGQTYAQSFEGAVYSLTNKTTGNTIAAFGRNSDGTLTPINEFATGGLGGAFDAGEGLDPLISQDSLEVVDNRFLLAVNPGSDSISSLRINPDFSLSLLSTASTGGVGPNSIAYNNGLVYVSNIDSDGVFTGGPDSSGNITGFNFDTSTGQLTPIAGSTRELGDRPTDVRFSSDGQNLVTVSFNAGSALLPNFGSGVVDEVKVFGVQPGGLLSADAVDTATSTELNNTEGRNLPSGIGFDIIQRGGDDYVVVTEAREIMSDGVFAGAPAFQVGSVSTWRLAGDGSLTAISQDVRTGPNLTTPNVTDAPTSACWIVASPDGSTLYVASASGASISTFDLALDGTLTLIDSFAVAGDRVDLSAADPFAEADGFIDITISSDGQYVYQLKGLEGQIGVYEVGLDPASLTFLQDATASFLPDSNIQGIVSVDAVIPEPSSLVLGLLSTLWWLKRRRNV